jgi:hypothetical protein
MIIRSEQLLALEGDAEERDLRRLVNFLRENCPEDTQGYSDEELEEAAGVGVEVARSYGLESVWAVTAFVTLQFSVAPDFDYYPPIKALLLDERFSPDERMNQILQTIPNDLFLNARHRFFDSQEIK